MNVMGSFTLRWEPPPVYFMHIPKTAGTSLRKIFQSAYARQEVAVLEVPILHKYTLTNAGRFRCYLSQCGPNVPELIGRSDLIFVTMLRDPVEWGLSALYFHQDNLANHPNWFQPDYLEHHKWLIGLDLRALLDDPHICGLIENGQTRMLGLLKDFRPFWADGAVGRLGQPARVPHHIPAVDNDLGHALTRACQWLDEMAVVGLTERFAESAMMMCGLLGIPCPTRLPNERIGVKKSKVEVGGYRATTPPDLIEKVESLTRYDQELYAYATALFEERWARYQGRPRRSYSIAPRLRMPVSKVKFAAKGWIKRNWPGLVEHIKRRKARR
jgi:hypothetical protein